MRIYGFKSIHQRSENNFEVNIISYSVHLAILSNTAPLYSMAHTVAHPFGYWIKCRHQEGAPPPLKQVLFCFGSLLILCLGITASSMTVKTPPFTVFISPYHSSRMISSLLVFCSFSASKFAVFCFAGLEFHELLDIPQGDRRKYHDDVTVMVISLEGRIWKSSGKYL